MKLDQPLPPPARDDRLRCDDVDARSGLRCTLVLHPEQPGSHFYVSPGLLATARVPLRTDEDPPA